ncbi:6084_t:CDS:2 [Ambispora gerdemannii]|uniref:6084_t:CDS:1 n=1 Tax=Ambispora gerdemannii TaxID=144530 RepID=A0A9N9A5X0_9GLOM|nr:6084_t:CDS:2 [Ambispora gerdemannii]
MDPFSKETSIIAEERRLDWKNWLGAIEDTGVFAVQNGFGNNYFADIAIPYHVCEGMPIYTVMPKRNEFVLVLTGTSRITPAYTHELIVDDNGKQSKILTMTGYYQQGDSGNLIITSSRESNIDFLIELFATQPGSICHDNRKSRAVLLLIPTTTACANAFKVITSIASVKDKFGNVTKFQVRDWTVLDRWGGKIHGVESKTGLNRNRVEIMTYGTIMLHNADIRVLNDLDFYRWKDFGLKAKNHIKKTVKKIKHFKPSYASKGITVRCWPYYSKLLTQQPTYENDMLKTKKIQVCTNAASVGITFRADVIVDSGRQNYSVFDPKNNVYQMMMGWVTNAEEAQRIGKIGRVRDGLAV